jgi:hypothetical protein
MIVPSFTSAMQLLAGSVELELYGRESAAGASDIRASFAVTSEKLLTNVSGRGSTGAANTRSVRKSS